MNVPTLKEILQATLEELNISKDNYNRAKYSRLANIVKARQMFCLVARHYGYSQKEMAKFLNLNNSTINHNKNVALDHFEYEKGFANKVNGILSHFEYIRKLHVVNGWVARDGDEERNINFFKEKPKLLDKEDKIWFSPQNNYQLHESFFPQLTFEDSPIPCEITLRLK